MKKRTVLFMLHGFLGKPSDFSEFFFNDQQFDVVLIDLYLHEFSPPHNGLKAFAASFNDWVIKHYPDCTRFLCGYSLGGRLALHVLLKAPHIWSGGIIISSHTGLKSKEEKTNRQRLDNKWAQRFLDDNWEVVMKDWNAQSVFCGDFQESQSPYHFVRREKDYDRKILSDCLRGWSLAEQDDLQQAIEDLDLPLFLCAGENDEKYCRLYAALKLKNQQSSVWIASNAHHRLLWQRKSEFEKKVKRFLLTIDSFQNLLCL